MTNCTITDLQLLLRAEAAGSAGTHTSYGEASALRRLVKREMVEVFKSAHCRITDTGRCFLRWTLDELTRLPPDPRAAYTGDFGRP